MRRLRLRPGIEFVAQQTVRTHSDHDALLVLIRVTNRRGRVHYYVHVTWNAGNGTTEDLRRVLSEATSWSMQYGIGLVVLSGQEWGDRDDLYRTLRARGYTTTPGIKAGTKSTPFAWSEGWRKRRTFSRVLLLPRYIGPGAGPVRNKLKSAVGAVIHAPGLTVKGWSAHWVPTQGKRLRFLAALTMTRNLVARVIPRLHPSSGGADTNTDARQGESLAPMVAAGWTDNQRVLGRIVTHPPNRAIDRVFIHPPRRTPSTS